MDCPYIPLTFRMWDSFAWFKLMKDESKSKAARWVIESIDLAGAVVLLSSAIMRAALGGERAYDLPSLGSNAATDRRRIRDVSRFSSTLSGSTNYF